MIVICQQGYKFKPIRETQDHYVQEFADGREVHHLKTTCKPVIELCDDIAKEVK
ncbi:MAG: hypothetical protein ACHQ1D_00850 [Nitrososphaerales archaeon]